MGALERNCDHCVYHLVRVYGFAANSLKTLKRLGMHPSGIRERLRVPAHPVTSGDWPHSRPCNGPAADFDSCRGCQSTDSRF